MFDMILLQAGQGGGMSSFVMLGAMALIFYVFFIRPQQKKQKEQKKYSEEVKKGDPVVTVGGIHGKIVSVDDTTVTIEVDKGARMKVEKSSISMEASRKLSGSE